MPIRLPLGSLIAPLRRLGGRPTAAKLSRYGASILLLPVEPRAALWAALPHGALLRNLYLRKGRKPGDSISARVGANAQTLLVVGFVALIATGAKMGDIQRQAEAEMRTRQDDLAKS